MSAESTYLNTCQVIEHLEEIWSGRTNRSTQLIVPHVSYSQNKGSLNNDHWAYNVTYAFREALDIKYEKRTKNKTPYMVWTQGPILNFKEGDFIHSRMGFPSVQVKFANIMGWDPEKGEMYLGSVTFDEYETQSGKFIKVAQRNLNQIEFLTLLIDGKKTPYK